MPEGKLFVVSELGVEQAKTKIKVLTLSHILDLECLVGADGGVKIPVRIASDPQACEDVEAVQKFIDDTAGISWKRATPDLLDPYAIYVPVQSFMFDPAARSILMAAATGPKNFESLKKIFHKINPK